MCLVLYSLSIRLNTHIASSSWHSAITICISWHMNIIKYYLAYCMQSITIKYTKYTIWKRKENDTHITPSEYQF